MPSDTELLNWLEHVAHEGSSPALINDDNGHWAVSFDGWQNVPDGDKPNDICTTFVVKAHVWHNTVREALTAAINDDTAAKFLIELYNSHERGVQEDGEGN